MEREVKRDVRGEEVIMIGYYNNNIQYNIIIMSGYPQYVTKLYLVTYWGS